VDFIDFPGNRQEDGEPIVWGGISSGSGDSSHRSLSGYPRRQAVLFPLRGLHGYPLVIRRARTFEEAWQGLRWQPVQVVVYDGCLPQCDWKDAFRSFSAFPGHPRVVLAAPEVDEDIWRAVLRCHGYDAVRRSAGQKEWIQMLRFAWLTRFREREGNRTADARIASLSVPIR
jgi:hypothetical protein